MTTSMHRSADIKLTLPREQVLALFTPEGERRWAGGWDPHYPDPDRREGRGAVFTTSHGGHETTWIIVEQHQGSIRYARVVHGVTAGTIAVDVLGCARDVTDVRVTYDLTALSAAGERWLEAFDTNYESEITGWSTEIAAALRQPS
jgi:hypothetical protein